MGVEKIKSIVSLQGRLNILNGEILAELTSGEGEEYSNMDLIKFKPGTIRKINDLMAQRKLIVSMMMEENARN